MPDSFVHPTEDQLGAPPIQDPRADQRANEDTAEGDKQPAVTPEQIVELQTRLEEMQRQNRDLLQAVFAGRSTQDVARNAPVEEKPVEISYEGLPDPIMDREGFLKGVAERTAKAVNEAKDRVARSVMAQQQAELQGRANLDSAWEMMQEEYPEIAKHRKVVEMAAIDVVNDLRAQRIDPAAYMSANMAEFVSAVAEHADEIVTSIRGKAEPEDDAGRTAVLGGMAGGTRRGTQKPAEQPGNFVEEIKKIQREMRIY